MKKLLFLLLIGINVAFGQTISNIRLLSVLGSDTFEGDSPWVNFGTPGYSFGFNNLLGGVNGYSWSTAWGGAAVNNGASASEGVQSMQIHWGGVVPLQGFTYNTSKIYKFEVMVHPPSGNDGAWNNWGAIHLFCSNNSNLWQTTGLRIRLTNGGTGGNPNRLAVDSWEGISSNYNFDEIKDFSANPNDYLVDGTSAKYWIPMTIIFTGAGNAINPLKVDFYLNQTFAGSLSFNNLTGFGDNLIGLSQNGNDGDVAKFDNVRLSEMASTNVNINQNTNASTLINCSTCDVNVESNAMLSIDEAATFNNILLNPGAKLTVPSGITLTTSTGVTLQSDATGTATLLNSGTYTGTINAQQYLGAARNWYVCSPISNATSPSTNITRYYEYVESGDNADFSVTGSTDYWKGLNTGTTMAVGKGYIAQTSTGTTVQFSGTANNGDIMTTFDLTRNDAKGKGFNLVGNPYPSYLDWVDVTAANPNLDNTYYYRTKNSTDAYTFVIWNGAGSSYVVSNGSLPVNSTVTRYLPPTQAFWVRVKTGTSATKMNFTNAMREHRDDNGNLMKAPGQNTRTNVRLQLQNGTESDELLIYQDAAASNSYDAYDSPKMLNNSTTIPDLYCITGDERLVINGLNTFVYNTELPLGFSLNAAATLKFKASELSNMPAGTKLYLRDKQENSETELTPEAEYIFSTTSATSNNENRFSLLFKTPGVTTGTTNANNERISVFVNAANHITIIAAEKSNYAIYNAMGQLIENGILNSELETRDSKLAAGVYVVKVDNQSTRVIIK